MVSITEKEFLEGRLAIQVGMVSITEKGFSRRETGNTGRDGLYHREGIF